MCGRHQFVLVAMLSVLVGLPGTAAAQECQSEALDTLAKARRARSFHLDFSKYRTAMDGRFDRLYRWLEDDGKAQGWSGQLTFVGDSYKFGDYTLCTPDGPKSAQLNGGWNGFAVEARHQEADLIVRLMIFDAGDGLAPDDVPRDENGDVVFGDDTIGYGKFFYGLYVQVTDWVGATVGAVSDSRRLQHIGTTRTEDGTIKSTSTVESTPVGESEWYVSASIPRWDLSTDLIFGISEGLDLGMVRATAIPILPKFQALAGGGYMAYEDTGIGYVGARYIPWSFAQASVEFGFEPTRLRSAIGRAEIDWDHPFHFDLELQPGQTVNALVGFEVAAFVEASLYNSAYLEDQLGRTHLFGVVGGGSFGVITRPIGFNLEIYGGKNAAHYVARLVDIVDKPLFGLRLIFRAGW